MAAGALRNRFPLCSVAYRILNCLGRYLRPIRLFSSSKRISEHENRVKCLSSHATNFRAAGDPGQNVRSLCEQGRIAEALHVLKQQNSCDGRPDFSMHACLLMSCANMKFLAEGRLIHSIILQKGISTPDLYLETKLLNLYVKCGALKDARQVFDEMDRPNTISWTILITAHVRRNLNREAIDLFYKLLDSGIRLDCLAAASALPACASLGNLEEGRNMHREITRLGFESHDFAGSALVDMYVKCGDMEIAQKLFENLTEKNDVNWTLMISAYAKIGQAEQALSMFCKMKTSGVKPTSLTYVGLIPAFTVIGALRTGKVLHQEVIKRGLLRDFAESSLIDMYVKCGSIENARQLFDEMSVRDSVATNAMIAGYAQNGLVEEAVKIFQNMNCRNVVSWTSMVSGLCQNGRIKEAERFFQSMPERNVVSWTAMISGYAQNDLFHECLALFREMQSKGLRPKCDTFASVLSACSNLAELCYGEQVHSSVVRSGLSANLSMANALVSMYAKCGSISDAAKIFHRMSEWTRISWNSMIVGCAMHGQGRMALEYFEQMQRAGEQPNDVTFTGVLCACCHSGLVDDGWRYFHSMSRDFGIAPSIKHYCCMVDVLGRSGLLNEGKALIDRMPMDPNEVILGSLLRACRVHNNLELGEQIAERLIELDPSNSLHYVQLSRLYASAGRRDEVARVRMLMKRRNVTRKPACSRLEIGHNWTSFVAGDGSHPQTKEIYAKLKSLFAQMQAYGYKPDTSSVLHDVDEQQKISSLLYHSEKLAIAFALISTPAGMPIRIFNNLTVCGDCHTACKYISKITSRYITIRGSSRFHHFSGGHCSCGDYW